MDEATEREHMLEAIRILTELTGERPLGWYTGRLGRTPGASCARKAASSTTPTPTTTTCPTGTRPAPQKKPHLVIPYTLDTNDMRFTQVQGFNKGDDFFEYLQGCLRRALCRR